MSNNGRRGASHAGTWKIMPKEGMTIGWIVIEKIGPVALPVPKSRPYGDFYLLPSNGPAHVSACKDCSGDYIRCSIPGARRGWFCRLTIDTRPTGTGEKDPRNNSKERRNMRIEERKLKVGRGQRQKGRERERGKKGVVRPPLWNRKHTSVTLRSTNDRDFPRKLPLL